MASTNNNHPYFSLLSSKKIPLPIGMHIWQMDASQFQQLSTNIGTNSLIQKERWGRILYSWTDAGPIVGQITENIFIGFESNEDAMFLLPKIRLHGLVAKEQFWYLVLEREEMRPLIAGAIQQNSIVDGEVYEISQNRGFLDRMGDYGAHWFQSFEHLKQYEAHLAAIDALL